MKNKKMATFIIFLALTIAMMGFLITDRHDGSEEKQKLPETKALVLEVNNDNVIQQGIARIGSQQLEIKILEGEFKGNTVSAQNNFLGQLDVDNFFKKNDRIIAGEKVCIQVISPAQDSSEFASIQSLVIASGVVSTGLNTTLQGRFELLLKKSEISFEWPATRFNVSSP